MYEKLRTPNTICLRILHEDLGFRKCCLRWVPHSMADNEALCRVTFSEELPQNVRHAKETSFKHLSTSYESWFYYEYSHGSAWAASRAILPTRKHWKFKPKARFPLFSRRLAFTVFLLCLPGYGTMRSSSVHLFCLRSKGISATASVGRRFGVSTSISIVRQLRMPNGRGKKVPEQM
jgi:hypothetical protein